MENLSEHDEIVENCFEEPKVKQETTSDAQYQEEAHTLLSEGIRKNLPTWLCRDVDKLPLDLLENKQDVGIHSEELLEE